jgi:hypothetical protein
VVAVCPLPVYSNLETLPIFLLDELVF